MTFNPHQLWPKPYEDLTEALYSLRRHFREPIILACSLVHPRHSIPKEHLQLLNEIKEQKPVQTPPLGVLFLKAGVCFFSALYDTFILLCLKLRFGLLQQANQDSPIDLVIKTWVPGPEGLKKETDFYYGSIADSLAKSDINFVFLAGDGRSDDGRLFSKLRSFFSSWEFVSAIFSNSQTRYFPEILLIPILEPMLAFFKQFSLSIRLRRFSIGREAGSMLARVSAQACLDVLRPYTTKNLAYRNIGKNAAQKWRPRAVMTLYEGQPWEKLLWLGAREEIPKIRLIGYQHTVVMAHSLSLIRPNTESWEISVPDVALCTGEGTKKLLQPGHETFGTQFLVFGSYRRQSTLLVAASPRPEKKTVLILPEGIWDEVVTIFNTVMEIAAHVPDHHFIFRCHPVLPFEKVAAHLIKPLSSCPNIELSTQPLIQIDFERSSALIYRGSSAVLYAVLSGLKPFCLLDPNAPQVDPLFLLPSWREVVANQSELIKKLLEFSLQRASEVESEFQNAANYVESLVQPVTAETQNEFQALLRIK